MVMPQAVFRVRLCLAVVGVFILPGASPSVARASFVVYTANADTAGGIAATVDVFRASVGAQRQEINWDGVPSGFSDPNLMPADLFNTIAPRGAEFSTPGTGFMVSANAGGVVPTLFGFPVDFQTFSAQKLFTALNSNITDVTFFVPGTNIAATTSAFGAIFTDVEVPNLTHMEFFDESNNQLVSVSAPAGSNQGLSFVGVLFNAGERISRVRITAGANTIVSNGVLGNLIDDVVVMDDFIFADPVAAAVPEPSSLALVLFGATGLGAAMQRRKSA